MNDMTMNAAGAVFVQTNEERNRVLAFARDVEGHLGEAVAYETGGRGTAMPHLPSQGSVVLSADRRFLLVANAGSNDLAVFAVDGASLRRIGLTPSGGETPRSIAEHAGTVFVLNTGKPGIASFRLGQDGLKPVVNGGMPMSAADADPAQIAFAPDGRTLVVTQRGTDSIATYAVQEDGTLGSAAITDSSGPTPYGFAFSSNGTLIVTEAFRAQKGAAAASSYALAGGSLTPVTRSLGNGMSEICWAVVTPDDRFVFTTNFADSTVSRFAVGSDGTIALEDASAGSTDERRPGLRDEDLSDDGRFLYAIDADAGILLGWRVAEDGSLTQNVSASGLPVTVAGVAAR
jgi:6-phosphogluconolactonase